MTNAQLEKLYATACAGKGFEPSDGQFKVWKQTLGWIEEADLAKALVYWFTDSTGFPMPAELKPLAARAQRERTSRKDLTLTMSKCALCGRIFSGFHAANDHTQRYCYGQPRNGKSGECGGNLVAA